ncbi:MAG: alpha/beta fold hydrolase [Rhodobacteraceae bacterium]|nr:alpha/beta fold hydrolase [Paracoccaceae bacterium]
MLVILLTAAAVLVPFSGRGRARLPAATETIANLPDASLTVYTYWPECHDPGLLLVFHGTSRTAARYRDYARPLADRACLVVIAPLFDKDRFPNWAYHRGGIVRGGSIRTPDQWTTRLVAELVAWARQTVGRPDAPYYLFGHSAGGQFLSRVAAYSPPPEASRIVIANPSTYVLASATEPVPYGFGGLSERDPDAALRAYLALPITIYLGADDTGDKNLTDNGPARRQGANRLERGRATFAAARQLADRNGWTFGWEIVEAPGIGHSARGMLQSDQAGAAFGLAVPTASGVTAPASAFGGR